MSPIKRHLRYESGLVIEFFFKFDIQLVIWACNYPQGIKILFIDQMFQNKLNVIKKNYRSFKKLVLEDS